MMLTSFLPLGQPIKSFAKCNGSQHLGWVVAPYKWKNVLGSKVKCRAKGWKVIEVQTLSRFRVCSRLQSWGITV
jgi:hypothetical protein